MEICEVKVGERRCIANICFFSQNFQTYDISLNKKNDTMKTFSKQFLQKNDYLTWPSYDLEKMLIKEEMKN